MRVLLQRLRHGSVATSTLAFHPESRPFTALPSTNKILGWPTSITEFQQANKHDDLQNQLLVLPQQRVRRPKQQQSQQRDFELTSIASNAF